jgi:hypothetical protein
MVMAGKRLGDEYGFGMTHLITGFTTVALDRELRFS